MLGMKSGRRVKPTAACNYMKILVPGKVVEVKPTLLRGTCISCQCQVECEPTDEAIRPYPRSKPEFIVKCPTSGCGGLIGLKEYVTRG
jgi:hypothetical protein